MIHDNTERGVEHEQLMTHNGVKRMSNAILKMIIAFAIFGLFRLCVCDWVTDWPTTIGFSMILAGFVANSQS